MAGFLLKELLTMNTRFLILAVLTLGFGGAESALACGQKTFPKVECKKGRDGSIGARLCTNRRNGLAWEWIFVGANEARDLCGDLSSASSLAPAADSPPPAFDQGELDRNGQAARATAARRGVTFEDLIQQRRAQVIGTHNGRAVYEYRSFGRNVRLY
jgi:hypothetical protein